MTWLLASLLLLQTFTACRGGQDPAEDTTAEEGTTYAETTGSGILTLEQETEPSEPEEMPPLLDLRDDLDYTSLVITSYYATGNVVGKALVAASYVEIHNGADTPMPLAGVSLYVSNRDGDFTEYRFSEGDTIPAKGFFLVRGRDANGAHEDVLKVDAYDTCFRSLSPDPD